MADKETPLMSWQQNLTPEQLKEITSNAGKASVKARQEKKQLKNYIKALLEIKDEEGIDNYTKLVISLYTKALNGDVQAFNSLRDTIGEKPKDEVSLETPTKIKISITDE